MVGSSTRLSPSSLPHTQPYFIDARLTMMLLVKDAYITNEPVRDVDVNGWGRKSVEGGGSREDVLTLVAVLGVDVGRGSAMPGRCEVHNAIGFDLVAVYVSCPFHSSFYSHALSSRPSLPSLSLLLAIALMPTPAPMTELTLECTPSPPNPATLPESTLTLLNKSEAMLPPHYYPITCTAMHLRGALVSHAEGEDTCGVCWVCEGGLAAELTLALQTEYGEALTTADTGPRHCSSRRPRSCELIESETHADALVVGG
ncbi:hypothetical protein K439DRAFT_1621598 [Ramaria rubella]|nr:hypothetical protein K439DRAFT_1621598 [Ramaria rubella]